MRSDIITAPARRLPRDPIARFIERTAAWLVPAAAFALLVLAVMSAG